MAEKSVSPESYWLIMPEAPEDDGKPTGRYFGFLYSIEDKNPITGEVELSEEPVRESGKFFESRTQAEQFLAASTIQGSITD